MYVVRVAVWQSKRVEMGLKGIEMNWLYSEVYITIIIVRIEVWRDKLFHTGNAHYELRLCTVYGLINCSDNFETEHEYKPAILF